MRSTEGGATRYALAALPVFGVALVLYARTLLPDVGVWDTAEFQAIGTTLGVAHPTGYPTYTLLAWLGSVVLTPFGNAAYRADLLSALLMAGAAALLAVATVQMTRRWPIGLLAGLTFALTPVAWHWGQRADPHVLHVFMATLLLVLLSAWAGRRKHDPRRAARWLVAAAFVFGLALGNHALTLLLVPGIAAYVLMVSPRILWRRWRLVLLCVAVIALSATLVYLYLPLRSAMDPPLDYADPETWDAFWYVVLGEQFRGSFGPLPTLADIVAGMGSELGRNLGLLSILAVSGALVGLLRHPRRTVLSLLWFGCTWIFAIGYPNAAIERYYLVPLSMAALWVGLAADAAADALHGWLQRPAGPTPAKVLGGTLLAVLLMLAVLPAANRYHDLDASADTWGRQIIETTFKALEPDAVVLSWWSFSTPLWYGRWVESRREDVTIIDDRDVLDDGLGSVEAAIDRYLDERPVYLIRLDQDLNAIRERYELELVPGVATELYRVVARKTE